LRPGLQPDTALDRIAIRLNLAPVAAGHAMFGMPMARVMIAGQRLGIFARLARGAAKGDQVAQDLGMDPAGTMLLLDSLAALEHVDKRKDQYSLSRSGRKWLDPDSPDYVGTYIEHCFDYWSWWDRLEDIVRTGEGIEIHDFAPGDPHWETYIRGQFELARISSPEVAKALRLPPRPESLLDVAGGHGWYSAELCRRHPTLHATVLDLPGSAAVGRRIIAEQGMSDRVRHVDGDMMSADLGGPHDGALVFNIVHHLPPEQNIALLRRIHAALQPGGTVAVLDLWLPEDDRRPDASAMLGLFFYLTSSAATYAERDVRAWLTDAGFERIRKVGIRRLPGQALFEARKPG
jgi:ubiquinone/menaquinone biosynthesis C-methylase UbiE